MSVDVGQKTAGRRDVKAVVLASGRGRRIGGPKALLCWGGEPLAAVHVATLRDELGISTVVVTRRDIACDLKRAGAELDVVISFKDDDWGPGGSIAAAAQSPHLLDRTWTLLLHVDQVPIAPALVSLLLSRCSDDVDAVRPVYQGRGGHPVLVRTERLSEMFGHDSRVTLRELMNHPDTRRLDVCVADPKIRQDLDTPEMFVRVTGRAPRFCFGADAGKTSRNIDR